MDREATPIHIIKKGASWQEKIADARNAIFRIVHPDRAKVNDHLDLASQFGVSTDYLDSIGLSKNAAVSGKIVHETELYGNDKVFKTPIAGKPRYFISDPDITTVFSDISYGWDVIEGKRIVAKQLSGDLQSPSGIEALRREVLLQAGLDPEHTVRILDLITHQRYPIIIMEREERTLSDLIRRKGNLSPEDIVSITGGIISNLRYLRSIGVVHRDIKTSNIYLNDGEQRTRLGDFGIAMGVRDLKEGLITGTPTYISPERLIGQANLENSQELERDEIYTLGLMVYEMISGETYFTGGRRIEMRSRDEEHKKMTDAQIIYELMRENYFRLGDDPRLVEVYGADFLRLVDMVLSKSLSYYKEGRQRTMEEFFEDLKRAVAGEIPVRYSLPQDMQDAITASSKRR